MKRLLLLMVFLSSISYGQDLDFAVSSLINDLIAKDTVLMDVQWHVLKVKTANGKLSKQDSIEYVSKIRNRQLKLYRLKINESLKNNLKNDLQSGKGLVTKFGEEKVQELLRAIPANSTWEESGVNGSINFVEVSDTDERGFHQFSDPILLLKNKYLIYHAKIGVNINLAFEYVIFSIDKEKGYQVEDVHGILYH